MRRSSILIAPALCLAFVGSGLAQEPVAGERIKEADACGYVVDSTGSVVSEATVVASSAGKTLATTSTLSDGSFHFEDAIQSSIDVMVQARGFASATAQIDRIHPVKSEKKCKHPMYVVLAAGNGASFITNKKKRVPSSR